MRGQLAVLAALGAFAALAFGLVWHLTLPADGPAAFEPPPPRAPPPPAPIVLVPRPPVAAPAPAPAPRPSPVEPAPPRAAEPLPEPPLPGAWEAVPAVARPAALGPLGGAIQRALKEAEPRFASCRDEAVQAVHGKATPSQRDDGAGDEGRTPIVILEIETIAGGAQIVDAPLDTRARASDGYVSCVQSMLRGLQISHPPSSPGRRIRMLYPLTF